MGTIPIKLWEQFPAKIMGGSEVHCIPTSWIILKDDSTIVLVAYPDEPWEVSKERMKNYENREKNWTMYLAKIMYSTGKSFFTDKSSIGKVSRYLH
ncbi:unnamed protein product [Euphydryas editha]|uniref:Uncharacterized protein n=1 Tax=Euphydryas editha TaxID=104508 RepID=A0AAU9TRS0_EUPED|nr:unnamed protein product [Euphydryas editha]